jgi:hypothetical protein
VSYDGGADLTEPLVRESLGGQVANRLTNEGITDRFPYQWRMVDHATKDTIKRVVYLTSMPD